MAIEVEISRADAETLEPALHELLRRALVAAADARAIQEAELSLTLLDDVAIGQMNDRFLGHPGPTDVISFALYEAGELPVGDIYVGFQQAGRQAAENGVPLEEELARLAVHGTLHVLGEDHPQGDERLESAMWALQERIVAGLFE